MLKRGSYVKYVVDNKTIVIAKVSRVNKNGLGVLLSTGIHYNHDKFGRSLCPIYSDAEPISVEEIEKLTGCPVGNMVCCFLTVGG